MTNSKRAKTHDSDITSKPKAGTWDTAHTVVKAGLSAIPVAGGPAAEFFSLIIVPPLSKRRDKWMESITQELKVLEEKVEGFTIERLSQHETFITTIMHASQVAIRTHQKEKLNALRNSILNVALSNYPEEDLIFVFLHFVDNFTPWHLKILKFYENPHTIKGYFLKGNFPELREQIDFCNMIAKDLVSGGLISELIPTDIERDTDSLSQLYIITEIGKQFINFITSPLERDDEEP